MSTLGLEPGLEPGLLALEARPLPLSYRVRDIGNAWLSLYKYMGDVILELKMKLKICSFDFLFIAHSILFIFPYDHYHHKAFLDHYDFI